MHLQNNQNEIILLTPALLKKMFDFQQVESLVFINEKIENLAKKRAIKKLSNEKIHKRNQWITSLYGEERKLGILDHLVIRFMNPLVGYGVYTLSTIPTYTYIGEYGGLVRKRSWWKDQKNNYVFAYDIASKRTPWVIDAKRQGNFTRFFNHSFTPNLTSTWIISEGVCHIIFFSNRQIQKGEQLTYDYGPYFWKKRPYPITI